MPIIVGGVVDSSTTPVGGVSWSVELNANPNTVGLFVIGSSLLGGVDKIASDDRWITVPWQRVQSISVRRGGTSANRKYDAGEAVVTLDNLSGDYDPDNPYGPFRMGPLGLLSQGTGLRLRASVGSSVGVGSYDSEVMADSPVAYWRFDETSGNVVDQVGANDLVPSATPVYSAAPIAPGLGASVQLDSTQRFNGASPVGTLTAPFTVEGWFAPTNVTTNQGLFSTRAPGDNTFDVTLVSSGSSLTGLAGDIGNGSTWITTTANATVPLGSTFHVVYTVTSTGYAIYVDGLLVGSGTYASSSPRLWDATHQVYTPHNLYTASTLLAGRMSNVAVYPTALSAQRIATHYAAGTSAAPTMMFVGTIEEPAIQGHWARPVAVFTAVDTLASLGNMDVPRQAGQTGASESSSARAEWLLEQAAIPEALRSVEAGGRACLATTGGGTVRDALDVVAAGEAGRFFVDRQGVVTLTWHDAEYGKTSQVDYRNDGGDDFPRYVSIESSPGVVGITNAAIVSRIVPDVLDESGNLKDGDKLPDAGAQDADSVAQYGRREAKVDVVLESDDDVAALAQYLATRRSAPAQRLVKLESVPLEAMTTDQARAVLALDLGDLITVTQHTIDGREILWTANIESLQWDHDSPMTRLTIGTSPSDTSTLFGSFGWFLIGSSLLGGTDILAPY